MQLRILNSLFSLFLKIIGDELKNEYKVLHESEEGSSIKFDEKINL